MLGDDVRRDAWGDIEGKCEKDTRFMIGEEVCVLSVKQFRLINR